MGATTRLRSSAVGLLLLRPPSCCRHRAGQQAGVSNALSSARAFRSVLHLHSLAPRSSLLSLLPCSSGRLACLVSPRLLGEVFVSVPSSRCGEPLDLNPFSAPFLPLVGTALSLGSVTSASFKPSTRGAVCHARCTRRAVGGSGRWRSSFPDSVRHRLSLSSSDVRRLRRLQQRACGHRAWSKSSRRRDGGRSLVASARRQRWHYRGCITELSAPGTAVRRPGSDLRRGGSKGCGRTAGELRCG